MLINRSTFQVNGAYSERSVYGTVEVTIGRETKRVRASLYQSVESPHLNNEITAYGITGRYRTGMKAWPGSVTQRVDEKKGEWEFVHFGFDSRSGKHHKATISFA